MYLYPCSPLCRVFREKKALFLFFLFEKKVLFLQASQNFKAGPWLAQIDRITWIYALHQVILAKLLIYFPLTTSLFKINKLSKVYSAPSTWTWNSCFALPMGLLAVHWYVPSSAAVTCSIFNIFPKFSVSGSSLGKFPVTFTQLRWGVGLIAKKKRRKKDFELNTRLL